MVITQDRHRPYTMTTVLVGFYVTVVIATLIVLALLALAGSSAATSSAWIHAAVVAWFAVLLPIRLRAARRGSERGRWAVAIIATVSLAANVLEATLLSGLFPTWMRIEMIGVAVLMLAIVSTDLGQQ